MRFRYGTIGVVVLCMGLVLFAASVLPNYQSNIDKATNEISGIDRTTPNVESSQDKTPNTNINIDRTTNIETDITERDTSCSMCYTGIVTRIVDGDTIHVDDNIIRLAMVDTPERGESNYAAATAHTRSTCPIGTTALVDIDDLQIQDRYGRQIAKVTCSGTILNESLLVSNLADVYHYFCSRSEFASEPWLNNECT